MEKSSEKDLSTTTETSSSPEKEEPNSPTSQVEVTTEDIISFISFNIENLLNKNKKKFNFVQTNKTDFLYSEKIPLLKIKEYFIRIIKYSKIKNSTLIATLIYIKRFIIKQKFIINRNNIYKLILGCAVLSIKFNESSKYKNKFYSELGGLNVKEFNLVEFDIFRRLDFDLYILDYEYNNVLQKIINEKSYGAL